MRKPVAPAESSFLLVALVARKCQRIAAIWIKASAESGLIRSRPSAHFCPGRDSCLTRNRPADWALGKGGSLQCDISLLRFKVVGVFLPKRYWGEGSGVEVVKL